MSGSRSRPAYVFFFVIIAAVYIFLSAGFTISFGLNETGPAFSTFNSGRNGCALLFDTLGEMGYPVSRGFEPITRYSDVNAAQIVTGPDIYLDWDRVFDWVRRGGKLVWVGEPTRLRRMIAEYDLTLEYFDEIYIFSHGLGHFALCPPSGLTNGDLLHDRSAGRKLESVLSGWNCESILFNEYYHGYESSPNLFRDLPVYIKLIIIQLALAAAAIVLRLGKRFGRMVPYYEESEREENEFILALANIYEKSGKAREEYVKYINIK